MSAGEHVLDATDLIPVAKRPHFAGAKYDKIDQWVDWGDHTVTVDPIGNAAWIHEGGDTWHSMTVERRRDINGRATKEIMQLLDSQGPPPSSKPFNPTCNHLESLPHFPSRRSKQCDTWRGSIRDLRGVGNLPVIAQKLRDGALPDVDKETIERQMYEARDAIQKRIFDRSGVPNYGLPS